MDYPSSKEDWSFVLKKDGEQYVMICGHYQQHKWPADSLDLQQTMVTQYKTSMCMFDYVVTADLLFSYAVDTLPSDQFPVSNISQLILLDNVRCLGTERKIVNCDHNPIGLHNCGHYEDINIRCKY